jgi:hypothetical protein
VHNELNHITLRKKIYCDIETLQKDLDEYVVRYNTERTHQGKRCKGSTSMEKFMEGKKLFSEKTWKRG